MPNLIVYKKLFTAVTMKAIVQRKAINIIKAPF